MKLYEVGGCVRDEILCVKSKDIDFAVVLPPVEGDPFRAMVNRLKIMGFKIFLETPEHLTVRAQFPKGWRQQSWEDAKNGNRGLTADFVLARKEGTYSDGRRPDRVEPGTLEDDIFRRDFTMNALAKDSDGNIIDLVGGRQDIADGIIRAVGDPFERLTEDALRAVRALRFSVTKGFKISTVPGEYDFSLSAVMEAPAVLDAIRNNISGERIQVELSKMFRFDTVASLKALGQYPYLTEAMFSGRVSLDATLKTKGRGK